MINPDELKVSIHPERDSCGGQHVGTVSRGVKVEHLPTGTIAICTEASSQHINRLISIEMIEYALTHPKF